eukprot:129903_1
MSTQPNWSNSLCRSSYLGFCDAIHFRRNTSSRTLTDRDISIINNLSHYKPRRNSLVLASVANKTPIDQCIVDTYCQYALKNSACINDFMEDSQFLNLLSEDKDAWYTIRKHLSDYVNDIYKPIHKHMFQESETLHAADTHRMANIQCYISNIHDNAYRLKKVSQIDVVFVPNPIDVVTDEYFMNLGIKFESMSHDEPIRYMMKRFNATLQDNRNDLKRCIIYIMPNDKGYIFEPLTNHSVPSEICDYTEMPWICNTKRSFNIKGNTPICVSFHRHKQKGTMKTERVYLSYGSYCTRLYKRNLISVLTMLGVGDDRNEFCGLDWEEEIQTNDFKDDQYHTFIMTFFADLNLVEPDLNSYLTEQHCDEHTWSKSWCTYFVSDRALPMKSDHHYMYIPTAMEYYEYINTKVNEYYKSQGGETKYDEFINYIVDNQLENDSLEDNLGLNKGVDDCVLLEFDTDFPTMGDSI